MTGIAGVLGVVAIPFTIGVDGVGEFPISVKPILKNAPNPFRNTTRFTFQLEEKALVQLD
jgi:hypothetical protein